MIENGINIIDNNKSLIIDNYVIILENYLKKCNIFEVKKMLLSLLKNIKIINNLDYLTLKNIISILIDFKKFDILTDFIYKCIELDVHTYNTVHLTKNIYKWSNKKCGIITLLKNEFILSSLKNEFISSLVETKSQ